jgi:hypothetical protein
MAAFNSRQLRPAVHDAVHVQVRVAMYSSLAIFMLFVCCLGAPVAMVTRACRWAYPSVELACSCSCSENRSRARERLQGRSLHAMNGYRRLASITASFTAPGAVSSDHGLLVGTPLREYAVRSTRKRTLLGSIEYLWNAVLSVMKQVPRGKPRSAIKSGNFEPFTVASCEALTYAPLPAIAAMTQEQVQGTLPCEKKKREALGAYAARDVMILWNALSSMAEKSMQVRLLSGIEHLT